MPDTEMPLDLRIDQAHPKIDLCLRTFGVEQAAFLTACNPYSVALSASRNQARMDQLQHALHHEGWRWLKGSGIPHSDAWQAEPSVLILGMDPAAARRWGQRYQQNALVHVQAGHAPQLLWLAD